MRRGINSGYIEVLKPRATILLTFIGVCASVIAGKGEPAADRLVLAGLTVLLMAAGANGLTNYLDRDIDARLQRVKHRALPSKRISPPEKVLPLTIGLVVAGLAIAWWLQPLCFAFGLAGTLASVVWRKHATCIFPQGMLASWSPVLIGWWVVHPELGWELVLLCALIGAWLPLHVWSVMISHRDDYINAGLRYFPMSRPTRDGVIVMLIFSLVLLFSSIALYFIGGFTLLYLVVAVVLGGVMVYACGRLVFAGTSRNAWRLYKLSAFPYLGLIFLVMCLDIWLM